MKLRVRAQRRAFDRQLRRLAKFGDENQQEHAQLVMQDAELREMVYIGSVERFIDQGGAIIAMDEDSQVPILDRLIDFFKWLWESGALLEIIKLFLGGLTADEQRALKFQRQQGPRES